MGRGVEVARPLATVPGSRRPVVTDFGLSSSPRGAAPWATGGFRQEYGCDFLDWVLQGRPARAIEQDDLDAGLRFWFDDRGARGA